MKKLDKVKLVKEMSRERVGAIRPTRFVPDRRKKLLNKAENRDGRYEN